METIIDNRLRRDSTNLQASFEDLAIRSIIEGFQIESEPESLELERQKQQKKDEIILNQEFQVEVETPVCTKYSGTFLVKMISRKNLGCETMISFICETFYFIFRQRLTILKGK